MKSNLNFYYLLILSNILELSKFVCQVPQICQSTSCGNCQKKLVTLGCLSGISLDYCELIFFWLHCATTSCLWLSRWKQIKEYCFAPIHMKITKRCNGKRVVSSKSVLIKARNAKNFVNCQITRR